MAEAHGTRGQRQEVAGLFGDKQDAKETGTPGGDLGRSADASTARILTAGSRNSHNAAQGKRRIGEAEKALKKTRTILGGFDRKATVAAVMIVATALFGVELADICQRDTSGLESAIMGAVWGPSRPCRAKEIVFALQCRGTESHRRW